MRDFFDDFFNDFFKEEFKPTRRYVIKESSVSPLTDLWEEENKIIILFDLPGSKKEMIDLRVTDDGLTLKAEAGKIQYVKKINFPVKVIEKKAKTSFNNGVLELIIPIKEKKKK